MNKEKELPPLSEEAKKDTRRYYIQAFAERETQLGDALRQSLIARRAFHNLNGCNQYFERCENIVCNPVPTLACIDKSGSGAIPGDRVKVEEIAQLKSEIQQMRELLAKSSALHRASLGGYVMYKTIESFLADGNQPKANESKD
jgi:hypothetical protein